MGVMGTFMLNGSRGRGRKTIEMEMGMEMGWGKSVLHFGDDDVNA